MPRDTRPDYEPPEIRQGADDIEAIWQQLSEIRPSVAAISTTTAEPANRYASYFPTGDLAQYIPRLSSRSMRIARQQAEALNCSLDVDLWANERDSAEVPITLYEDNTNMTNQENPNNGCVRNFREASKEFSKFLETIGVRDVTNVAKFDWYHGLDLWLRTFKAIETKGEQSRVYAPDFNTHRKFKEHLLEYHAKVVKKGLEAYRKPSNTITSPSGIHPKMVESGHATLHEYMLFVLVVRTTRLREQTLCYDHYEDTNYRDTFRIDKLVSKPVSKIKPLSRVTKNVVDYLQKKREVMYPNSYTTYVGHLPREALFFSSDTSKASIMITGSRKNERVQRERTFGEVSFYGKPLKILRLTNNCPSLRRSGWRDDNTVSFPEQWKDSFKVQITSYGNSRTNIISMLNNLTHEAGNQQEFKPFYYPYVQKMYSGDYILFQQEQSSLPLVNSFRGSFGNSKRLRELTTEAEINLFNCPRVVTVHGEREVVVNRTDFFHYRNNRNNPKVKQLTESCTSEVVNAATRSVWCPITKMWFNPSESSICRFSGGAFISKSILLSGNHVNGLVPKLFTEDRDTLQRAMNSISSHGGSQTRIINSSDYEFTPIYYNAETNQPRDIVNVRGVLCTTLKLARELGYIRHSIFSGDDDYIPDESDGDDEDDGDIIKRYNFDVMKVLKPDTTDMCKYRKRLFGVELEVLLRDQDHLRDFVNHPKTFVLKHDGSIRRDRDRQVPVEVVTAPLSLTSMDALMDELHNDWFQGEAVTNSSCGVHVHVSRASIPEYVTVTLKEFIANPHNSQFLDYLTLRSENSYCRRQHDRVYKDRLISPETGLEIKVPTDDEKYRAINAIRESTIEFRLFNGSTDPSTIMRYVEFCDAILDYLDIRFNPDLPVISKRLQHESFTAWVKSDRKNHLQKWPTLCKYLGVKSLETKETYKKVA